MLVTTANSLFIFPVIPRSLKLGGVFSVHVRAMASGKMKRKSAVSIAVQAEAGKNGAIENVESKVSDTIMSLKNEPDKIQGMTVQDLRDTLRSVGASTKGRKHELVSALTSLVDKIDGGSSPTAKALDLDTELSRSQNSKRKKGDLTGNISEDISAEIISVQQNISTETADSSGKKNSRRKVTTKTAVIESKISLEDEESKYENEPWIRFAHKRPQKNWVAYNPRMMRQPPLNPDAKVIKLMSWNVNGLRALLKMEGFSALELAQKEDFDVLCLQETKIQEKDVEAVKNLLEGYENTFWHCSVSKLGYSGTAIISQKKPLSVKYGLGIPDHDSEGRLVTAEFDSFYLLSAYVPNSGDGLKRLSYRVSEWDACLSAYMKDLEKTKPVILTGDLNCAHEEIDIYNPAGNKRSAGFTDEERQSFASNFLSNGFVDTFRKQHPGVVGYTYWGYRHGGRKTNRGWRLDYFLVSESIADHVYDSYICPEVTGSDHCPVGLVLKF